MAGKAKGPLKELPKLDEWLAPWEEDSDGKALPEEDQKIDPARLKKYLHGLLGDKLKLQGTVDEVTVRAEELEDKVAKAADPAKLAELQAEVVKTQQERDEAAKKAEGTADKDLEILKLRVAMSKGLSEVQARRLLGSTKEELEQDAEELLASFGGKGQPADEDGVARGPRRNLTNSGDPDSGKDKGDEDDADPDKFAAAYAAKRGRGIR